MLITIDGPAGSGKSTVAGILAKKLNIIHFNSGSLFRGITAFALENNISPKKIKEYKNIILHTEFVDNVQKVFVNGKDYTPVLRNNEVSVNSSIYAQEKSVHEIIDNCQHEFAKNNSFVIDGRDSGSHVFPNADFKFYLDCPVEIRAERRYKEELEKGNKNITLDEVKAQIEKRDYEDKTREIAPLIVPENAIIMTSEHETAEQLADKMFGTIINNTNLK